MAMSDLENWAAARNAQDVIDRADGAAAIQRTCRPCGSALVSTGHGHPEQVDPAATITAVEPHRPVRDVLRQMARDSQDAGTYDLTGEETRG